MSLKIYVDGSAHPNPGPGGWGRVVINERDEIIETISVQFTEEAVTNNRMELMAVLSTMRDYGVQPKEGFSIGEIPIVYCDSAYVVNTFNNWMFNWVNNNWIKSDKKIPENLDIIAEYYKLYQSGYRIDLQKIRGHAGNQYNELADKLATGKFKKDNENKGEIYFYECKR